MCQQVMVGGESYWNLKGLLGANVISAEHVPSDPELARSHINVLEVCFCSVDVEGVLAAAGVGFTEDEAGDLWVTA
jgi:hypothetical protein